MSDGNFNRALLPPTPYRSGVKMGYQQAKAKIVSALNVAFEKVRPALTDEQKQEIMRLVKAEL